MPAAQRLPLAAVSAEQERAWRALADRAAEPNPFFEPDYVVALADGLGETTAVELLVVADGDAWLACLPVVRTRRWHRLPLPNVAAWRGHPLYGLLGTPLLDRDRATEAAAALVAGLRAERGAWLSSLEWVAEGGPAHAALTAALGDARTVRLERFRRAVLHRRPQDDYLEQTTSSKHRRELRRQTRKLGEEHGDVAVRVTDGTDAEAVRGFLAMEARQLGPSERGHPVAQDPGHERFFTAMCERFADRMEILVLEAGGTPVAYKLNLRAGPAQFMVKITFDADLARFSPGMQLETEMVRRFHVSSGIQFLDSCADPNNAMINRLWPDRVAIVTLAIPARGPRGAVAGALVRALRAVRNRLNGDLE